MNKFEKQLEKWNNGVLRGAQAKLAKTLGVSTATTALWATGKRRPSKGYVAQMAQLFGLDSFDVFKLFDYRSTTYPEPRAVPSVHALRDQDNGGCSYLAGEGFLHESDAFPEQSNSVQLPFLNSVPAHYPNYEESDIIEWWSVPRRFAQGAKYILRTADTGWDKHADKDDLCLVKPGQELAEGKIDFLLGSAWDFRQKEFRFLRFFREEIPQIERPPAYHRRSLCYTHFLYRELSRIPAASTAALTPRSNQLSPSVSVSGWPDGPARSAGAPLPCLPFWTVKAASGGSSACTPALSPPDIQSRPGMSPRWGISACVPSSWDQAASPWEKSRPPSGRSIPPPMFMEPMSEMLRSEASTRALLS